MTTLVNPGQPALSVDAVLPTITPVAIPEVASNRAVLYLRLSEDELARGTDVTDAVLAAELNKQRTPALKLCKDRGLEVVGEYVDLDKSAYQKKPRPAFEDLLRDAPAGAFDYVVPMASDRLYRKMSDLTRITDELARHVRILPVLEGEVELTTAAGIMQAQVLGALGEFESRRKAERVAAKAASRAKDEGRGVTANRPVGWTWADPCPRGDECEHRRRCKDTDRRPRFGSRAGLVPDPVEAPLLVESYQRIADGAAVRAVHRDLWSDLVSRPIALRRALLAPRHAGLVRHQGETVGEATDGVRIVDVELWQTVRAILEDPARHTGAGRPAQTYLTGIVKCWRCDGPMNAQTKHGRDGKRTGVYMCGYNRHTSRTRDELDRGVLVAVRKLLVRDADDLRANALPSAGPAQTKAAAEVAALRARIASVNELSAKGALEAEDAAAQLGIIRADLVRATERAAVSAGKPATAKLLTSEDVGAAWDAIAGDVDAVRPVLLELIDRIDVEAGKRGLLGVEIRWCDWAQPAS
jgi:site-specific DNA recombinase